MPNSSYIINADQLSAENIFLSIGGKEILKGATIHAAKGSITGLLGKNGSGKSTMLQTIFGTRNATECDVFINGVKVKQPYKTHRLINYLPQHPFLPDALTVKAVLRQYETDTALLLYYFPELSESLSMKINELSGGKERLLSVLILLLADTRFTMLDEPFSHIAPIDVERLHSILLQQKEKKGIIITDHLYKPLLSLSQYLYLMKEGQSIFIKDRSDLLLHGYISNLPED